MRPTAATRRQLLPVERMGDDAEGIRLVGDPKFRPEPTHVRIVFPGGDVDVARCSDGTYWVHVRVDRERDLVGLEGMPGKRAGRIEDARLDIEGVHAADCNAGDFAHPGLYHLAVRVGRAAAEQQAQPDLKIRRAGGRR